MLDPQQNLTEFETQLIEQLRSLELPFLAVINKSELGINYELVEELKSYQINYHTVSCFTNDGIYELKEKIIKLLPSEDELTLVGDLIKQHDVIVLVVPIDLGAPKGRLIMPQVQAIRESLDEDAIVVIAKDKELRAALSKLAGKPNPIKFSSLSGTRPPFLGSLAW